MKRVYLALITLALTACTGNPSLPDRRIDRPYTLPEDTREVSFGLSYSTEQSHQARRDDDWTVPGGIAVPINANWTWDVLTSVRYQIHHDANDTLGLSFGATNLGYVTSWGLFAEPAASLYYRRNLARFLAAEATLGGNYLWREKLRYDPFRIYLRVGPVFQLDDTKALALKFAAENQRNYGFVYGTTDFVSPGLSTELVYPLAADFSWRFGQQWEGVLSYGYEALGYENGYRAQTGSFLLRHFW